MAHKKGTGSTRNGRDSNAKRLGVKAYGGEVKVLSFFDNCSTTAIVEKIQSQDDE